MCYAIPAKVISVDGEFAIVDYGGVSKTINLSLVDDIIPGSYVLIHAGFAIEKLDRKSAVDALKAIKKDMERINEEF